jgi:hypothetical protein
MTSMLGFPAVLLLSTSLGLLWLHRAYGIRSAVMIVLLSQGLSLVSTAYRFREEISHVQYTEISPDAYRYVESGRSRWVAGDSPFEGIELGDGTVNTQVLGQWFFSAFGDDRALVFLAGSTCGLLGLWLIALAIRTVRPDVPAIFGYAVCLTPAIGYWSSSFGKDAFTFLAVGAALWVVADATARSRAGGVHVLVFALAASLMFLIRVDIALVLVAALLVSLWGVHSADGPEFRRGLIVAVFVGAPSALLGATLLGLEDPFGIIAEYSGSYERTSLGASAIGSERAGGAGGLVVGAFTAIFRPFPWEFGLGGLISSLDVPVVALLVVVALRGVRRGIPWTLASARVTVFGSLVAIAVFSQLMQTANLGLLVRLRSLIIPVLIAIIAMLWERRTGGEAEYAAPVDESIPLVSRTGLSSDGPGRHRRGNAFA